ncbi:MAG: phosphate acetyltransferase [Candidatus Omnitrophica bacterium]|nr:phosphate acetyltransferase [Candidatus Omnitrophota bacterium]
MYRDVIQSIRSKARKDPKTIIFPETEDARVMSAVDYIRAEGIAEPILLSQNDIDPFQQQQFACLLYEAKKGKGMTMAKAQELMQDRHFYAAMMLRCGFVDGMVSGAAHATAVVMRAVINCLDINDRIGLVSSCFLMGIPNCSYGEGGVLCYADCGVMPDPTSEQLAKIAVSSAAFFEDIMDKPARVAMLSFSSKGSANGPWVEKVSKAVELAKKLKSDCFIDGELQADSALVPEVAALKLKDSAVAGKANVLIFPTLDAGNIGYKLTERLAHARAIGPLILGTIQPCSDLSRGCSVEDIIDVTAVTVVRAQKRSLGSQNVSINLDKHYAYTGL